MVQKTRIPISSESHLEAMAGTLSQLVKHIGDNGHTKASLTYPWYGACWFRDSSMLVLGLVDASEVFQDLDKNRSLEAQNAASSILNFMWSSIDKHKENIRRSLTLDTKSEEFKLLRNHLPARLNAHGGYFGPILHLDNLYGDKMEDAKDSWLRQYDSVSLAIIATERFVDAFGPDALNAQTKRRIKSMLNDSISYMLKTYRTPCANVWELDWDEVHSYNLAATSRGIRSASSLAEKLGIAVKTADLEQKAGEIDRFLERVFVRGGILYKSAKSLGAEDVASEPNFNVDASEIFIFSVFKPNLSLGIEERTIKVIEEQLFDGNVLPLRYLGDEYFTGGRWLLLGLAFAKYYSEHGRVNDAQLIIDYIKNKYMLNGHMLPEQEIVNPACPNKDPDHYLERNGGAPVSDLGWSESEYIRASIAYLKAMNSKAQSGPLIAAERL